MNATYFISLTYAENPQTPRRYWALAMFTVFFLGLNVAHAQLPTPATPPASPALEARLKLLETELRCLVCQNQTLAESPAGLANDLRREVRILADQGKSNEEIKTHLQARYGDFVLYKPPLSAKNWLLWFGPFVLLFAGAVLVWRMSRRPRADAPPVPATAPPTDEARQRAEALLRE